MNRFCFVAPRQSNEEVIECAVKLVEYNYEQRPNENKNHHHLFIDNKKKHFFFTDKDGMAHLKETVPAAYDTVVVETNLNQINQWKKRPRKIKA